MNAYILNGMTGDLTRTAIVKKLNIPFNEVYKTVKSIDVNGVIETKDGKKYELVLTEKL
jgi:predicted transcriptional regulator